jgi:hypothetical protein
MKWKTGRHQQIVFEMMRRENRQTETSGISFASRCDSSSIHFSEWHTLRNLEVHDLSSTGSSSSSGRMTQEQ